MIQVLPQQVPQESSAKVTADFKDAADGSAVTPDSVTWSLLDLSGNIINSRSAVVVSPASSVEIWLSGDDLSITTETNPYELRRLLIEATYNNGSEVVPIKQEGQFAVYNLQGV